jgi:hypothetical protein
MLYSFNAAVALLDHLTVDQLRSTPISGHPQSRLACLKRANSGLMRRRRVPLFDHLVGIGELLGQPRFVKTLNHQLRTF